MDVGTIVGILLAAGLLLLILLVIVRMVRKRPSRPEIEEPEEEEPISLPRPAEPVRRPTLKDERVEEPVTEPAGKAAPQPAPEPAPEPKVLVFPMPAAKPLGRGLERTRKEGFVGRLASLFRSAQIDDALLAQAEEALLTADIGVKTATALLTALKTEFRPGPGDAGSQVMAFLKDRVTGMLSGLPHGAPALRPESGPAVIMVAGVNGTGKTTTIGKLAHYYQSQGRKVLLAAGDTYRAAGADQLAIWGERVGVPCVVGKEKADPASVIFDAARRAVAEGFDLLIADTAGRLHTNVNLVDELKKVHRVIGKAVPGGPHEVLLVLDATMGQNAVRQADIFRQAVAVTGIVLSKLDGTAKGGVVLSIVADMGLPVRFVGVGEAMDDLRSFDAREFAEALFEPEGF